LHNPGTRDVEKQCLSIRVRLDRVGIGPGDERIAIRIPVHPRAVRDNEKK
jgi:hypothetical protein